MNTEWHGREIWCVEFPDRPAVDSRTNGCPRLWLSATYHGDRDEFWIIEEPCGGGEERRRFNARMATSIEWKPSPTEQGSSDANS